jgi:hypothetical protein
VGCRTQIPFGLGENSYQGQEAFAFCRVERLPLARAEVRSETVVWRIAYSSTSSMTATSTPITVQKRDPVRVFCFAMAIPNAGIRGGINFGLLPTNTRSRRR